MIRRRVLAIDPGTRRTGIALSDPSATLASPLETVELPLAKLVAHLETLIDQHAIGVVVLGCPMLPSGDKGPVAELSEEIGRRLARRRAVEVVYWNEALTSWEAETMLSARKKKRDKGAVDRLAATVMLQDYLDARE